MTNPQKKLAGGIVTVLAVLIFATNPDQATHLKAIKETVALRQTGNTITDVLLPQVQYNYIVFSTTTYFNWTLSRGYFGRVETTNDIGVFYGVVPK